MESLTYTVVIEESGDVYPLVDIFTGVFEQCEEDAELIEAVEAHFNRCGRLLGTFYITPDINIATIVNQDGTVVALREVLLLNNPAESQLFDVIRATLRTQNRRLGLATISRATYDPDAESMNLE
jgi:hypothetical protein